MKFTVVENWLNNIKSKYGVGAFNWLDGRSIEDNYQNYVAVIGKRDGKYGEVNIVTGKDLNTIVLSVFVVWKLKQINQEILISILNECSLLGQVSGAIINNEVASLLLFEKEKLRIDGDIILVTVTLSILSRTIKCNEDTCFECIKNICL